jgi:hypothetical protein
MLGANYRICPPDADSWASAAAWQDLIFETATFVTPVRCVYDSAIREPLFYISDASGASSFNRRPSGPRMRLVNQRGWSTNVAELVGLRKKCVKHPISATSGLRLEGGLAHVYRIRGHVAAPTHSVG